MSRDGRRAAFPWLVVLLCAAAAGRIAFCGDPEPGGGMPAGSAGNEPFDRRALLSTVGAEVVLPLLREFKAASDELRTATGEHSKGVAAGAVDVGENRAAARQAWRKSMTAWQELELLQIGPAGPSSKTGGGQGLRDRIYSWPTVNSCRVDQELVEGAYTVPGFFDTELPNVFGLDALEYLLFFDRPENTCPPQVSINQGAWGALTDSEKAKRRADYAHAVAGRIAEDADRLLGAWDPAQGDFAGQWADAGNGSSVYSSPQKALDELLGALFYIDLVTKDRKLAKPAGLKDCSQAVCPDALESPWADHSKENIAANLEGFQRVFRGGSSNAALGFDHALAAVGRADLATEIDADTTKALRAVDSIPGSLREALTANPDSVRAAHAAVKAMTDALKGDFATALQLSLPKEGSGDSD
ncbi:MAG: imelysin family protein [Nitrospirae bacterium]|nr:imelysin family protein [Nitrospirota bacterium]